MVIAICYRSPIWLMISRWKTGAFPWPCSIAGGYPLQKSRASTKTQYSTISFKNFRNMQRKGVIANAQLFNFPHWLDGSPMFTSYPPPLAFTQPDVSGHALHCQRLLWRQAARKGGVIWGSPAPQVAATPAECVALFGSGLPRNFNGLEHPFLPPESSFIGQK